MDAIKTSNLTKYYGKARGIIDLNLTVKEGEFFGFIGPNGAGKSTTIRTLLGLVKSSSGSAKIFGRGIEKEKTEILAEVGYLPSEAVFYSGMKVKDIIRFSAQMRKKDCKKEAAELCERMELDISRKVEELSFGNRKKVAIICALQHNPKLCILDEPTSGLDPLMQKEFFNILRERNQQGTTIFLSSHVLSEIQRNCSRAAIIRDGRLIACDSVEALANTSAKRVSVHGKFDLSGLNGIRDLKYTVEGSEHDHDRTDTGRGSLGSASFLYNGNLKELINRLAQGSITDLSVSEPDLEEIFLHYYEEEGAEK